MTNALYDLLVPRVSLVKRPATRKKFYLMKAEGAMDTIEELAKGVSHHIEALLDLLGEDDEAKKKVEQLVGIMEDGGEKDVRKLMSFLYSARELQYSLDSFTKEEVEEALVRFDEESFPNTEAKKRALRKTLAVARRLGVEYDKDKFEKEFPGITSNGLDNQDHRERPMGDQTEKKTDDKAITDPAVKKTNGEGDQSVVVSKAEFESLQKKIEGLEAKNTTLESSNKALTDTVAKAEEDRKVALYKSHAARFPHVPIQQDELAVMIRKMDEGEVKWEEHFTKLEESMKSSALLIAKGADGEASIPEGATEFEAEVEKRFKDAIAKSDGKKTAEALKAEITTQVAGERPDLYTKHREEARRR